MKAALRFLGFAAAPALALLVSWSWAERVVDFERRESAAALLATLRACAWLLPLLVALSALHHGRSRLSFAALNLAAAALTLRWSPSWLDAERAGLLAALCCSVACFAVCAVLDERGVFTAVGIPRLSCILVLLALPALLVSKQHAALAGVLELMEGSRPPLPGPLGVWCLGTLFVLGCLALLVLRRRDALEVGAALSWSFVAGWVALASQVFELPRALPAIAPTLVLLAGTLSLVQALYLLSWRHANLDELTSLPSRRALEERLGKLGRWYCLAVLDIDHFKKVNDRYGHEAGDVVLKRVADRLARFGGGRIYRSGGEEFTAVCTGRSIEKVAEQLERLRVDLARERILVPSLPGREKAGAHSIRVSLSIGAATRSARNHSPQQVLAAADEALLRAKKKGRNRLELEKRSSSDRSRRRSGKRSSSGRRRR